MTSETIPQAENKRHYPGLDGLRAVAVLMVFTQHYFVFAECYRWGWAGVQIFFVLSGFLITGILYDTREATNRYKVFYARRSLRIFPLYFAVLIVGWALWPIFRWDTHPAWGLAPFYLSNYSRFLWLQDYLTFHGVEHLRSTLHPPTGLWLYYGHFWSLSVEEQFYLLWPFVVFTVRDRRRLLKICAAAVSIVPLLRLLCLLTLPQTLLDAEFVYRITPLQCDALLLGAALALWMRGERRKEDLQRATKLACVVVLTLAVGFVAFSATYWSVRHEGFILSRAYPVFGSFGVTLVNLFAAAALLLAVDARTMLSRFLNLAALRWLGMVSYGFYVFHDIPHMAYARLVTWIFGVNGDPRGIYTGAVALVCTIALSALSYRFFETPFLRMKSWFEVGRQKA